MVAISSGGAYWEVNTKTRQEVNGRIKEAKHSLRSSVAIDNVIYACGMGRTVLGRKKTEFGKNLARELLKKMHWEIDGL